MTDRRPLGLPSFSEPAAPVAATDRPLVPPVDRALFQAPPPDPSDRPAPARRALAAGGLTFSDGGPSA
ncbi:hypothetical protein GXW83_17185 [Streptacidiphilus sp. PB12-B1b]|uniref:hypothetical protein n=1 Tax=Streptacidiphilus sp. PB12-B1b TaxID=2705012 RepID=UPI0015F9949C|nr:hypothetical protein [Streptacidiphilus sp. PB12-B1b]QMU77182.1 hypothetical protein GXW83_17185 [Streptacidiphilus sp. PB12-B1b]